MNEAAEVPQVAFPGGVQYGARAQKQQALHERMIDGVIHDGDQRERRRRAHLNTREYDRESESGET